MRWPAGQRFCYAGVLFIAAASPELGELLDDTGVALTKRDLARVLQVDSKTIERFLSRAVDAGRLLTRGDTFVVPEISHLLGKTSGERVDAGQRSGPMPGGR